MVAGEELARRRAALDKIRQVNPARAAEGEFRLNEKGFDEWAAKVLFPEPDDKEPKAPTMRTRISGGMEIQEEWNPSLNGGKGGWRELGRGARWEPNRPKEGDDPNKLTRGKAEDLAADKAKRDYEAAIVARASTPKGAASPIPDDYDYYLKRARESYGLPPFGGGGGGLPQTPSLSERGGGKVSAALEPPGGEPPMRAMASAATRALDAVSDADKKAKIDAARAAGYSDEEIARYLGLL